MSDPSSRNIRVAITRKKGGCDKSGSSARKERSLGGESRNRYIGRLKGKKRDAAGIPANAAERVVPVRAFYTATASLYLPLSAPASIFLPDNAKIGVTRLPFQPLDDRGFFFRGRFYSTPWIWANNSGGWDPRKDLSDRENRNIQ